MQEKFLRKAGVRETGRMNPSPASSQKVCGKFVGGGVPDAPRRGEKGCKAEKGVSVRLRAGHARPLQTAINGCGREGQGRHPSPD